MRCCIRLPAWALWLLLALANSLQAQPAAPVAEPLLPAAAPAAEPLLHPAMHAASAPDPATSNTLLLNQRHVVTFGAAMLGRTPAERVTLARLHLRQTIALGDAGRVSLSPLDVATGVQVDGRIVFYLLAADLQADQPGVPTEVATEAVRSRLQAAVAEVKEASDLRRIGMAAAQSLLASGLAYGALRLLWALRRWVQARTAQWLRSWQQAHPGQGLADTYAHHGNRLLRAATQVLSWLLLVLVIDLWATFVLGQFAVTRPWAERSTQWLLSLLESSALSVAAAVPGLLTAGLVFFIARQLSRAVAGFMQRVERGQVSVSWLDRDTARPTRQVGNAVIWLFALAIAYPFLPGANSEAFKGVSVLTGLMLSLGASSVVGQMMAGLSLMYSRTLRSGEYVKIGETEGTVTSVGMFATKIHTGMGEEVSLPNAVVFSQPVRNFSRLVDEGRFVLHTAVTIGYATPWRQVHAMLLEAARRDPAVATSPPPYVVQTALSDFYVEYRLCAQSSRSAPQRRAELMSQLHSHIQDVFNENGVQIMSPHYLADPPQPQVVPPADWAPGLAAQAAVRPPGAPAAGR